MDKIFWRELELVIFDVDGTLYNQSKLRRFMIKSLLFYFLIRPWKYKDLSVIYHFRQEREKRAGYKGGNLQEEQYEWCMKKTNRRLEDVKRIVNKWIFTAPNKYLKTCMYPGIDSFFLDLDRVGIKTAIYSDYNSTDKMKYMELEANLQVSSTDKNVNCFKPLPNGLILILEQLKISDKRKCLYIGDRPELDAACAMNAGIPFLLVDKATADLDYFTKLSTNLLNARYKS